MWKSVACSALTHAFSPPEFGGETPFKARLTTGEHFFGDLRLVARLRMTRWGFCAIRGGFIAA